MATNGDWLSVSEAAELSGYHPEYIRRLIRDGEIEARKFSIVWQVKRISLLDYIKNAKSKTDKRYSPKSKKGV
ncbi:MAG: helix-turn-helix domain-containing protein [Anaerolineales bacterium]|nr:helix-turn-helix domain-containing protein [Anaerolineales bacterium]